jgi:hypothetical protein
MMTFRRSVRVSIHAVAADAGTAGIGGEMVRTDAPTLPNAAAI